MRSLEWYWNMLTYCVYQVFKHLFKLISYLDPLIYILKIPAVKRFYAKLGVNDIAKTTQETADNSKSGINFIQAGIVMGSIIVLLTYAILNSIQPLVAISLSDWAFENDRNGLAFILIILFPSFLFNYLILFKGNKYLEYFKEFDEMDSRNKTKYYWMSLIVVVCIVSFFVISFKFTR